MVVSPVVALAAGASGMESVGPTATLATTANTPAGIAIEAAMALRRLGSAPVVVGLLSKVCTRSSLSNGKSGFDLLLWTAVVRTQIEVTPI